MVSPGEKTLKKKKRKTSKGSKDYYVRDKTGKSVCALCGATLHGSTGGRRDSEVRKLAKTKRRASVPFGGVLCTKCRRVVAEEKAKIAFNMIKKPVFVDDTGLAFNALNGMPGIYIKHFLESLGLDGLRKLLFGFKDKSAVAYASIGYCDGKKTKVFIGVCEGKIVKAQGKAKSFGWDGIFKPNRYSKTFASMPKNVKNKISHRRKALESFRRFLVK